MGRTSAPAILANSLQAASSPKVLGTVRAQPASSFTKFRFSQPALNFDHRNTPIETQKRIGCGGQTRRTRVFRLFANLCRFSSHSPGDGSQLRRGLRGAECTGCPPRHGGDGHRKPDGPKYRIVPVVVCNLGTAGSHGGTRVSPIPAPLYTLRATH